MSAAWMVEDGVIKIGTVELGRAISMLPPSDSGTGEYNLVNAFFRLKKGSTKGSLGRVHIVDDEMDVERKMRVQGVARLLVLGVAMRKNNSAFPKPKHAFFFHQKRCAATHPWALQLAKLLVSSRCLFLSSQLRWGFGSQSRSTHGFNCAANPLVQRTFMTTRPMFALWVVQPLPTSPGDPYLTSRCNQNEIR